jgi:hypothetical protein
VVNPAPQTISLTAPLAKVFGSAPFEVSATASSGLTVELEIVSGPAQWTGTPKLLELTGVGEVLIRASQPGNENYAPAPAIERTILAKANTPPTLTSEPQISPALPLAGYPVTATVATNDDDGDTVSVKYDWGDGSALTPANAHTYAESGSYTLQIVLNDTHDTVTVTALAPIAVAPVADLAISGISAKFRFGSSGLDSCQVSGTLPGLPALSFEDLPLKVDVGGAAPDAFVLDAHAHAAKLARNAGTLLLRPKFKNGQFTGGDVPFTIKLKGTFWSKWRDEGLDQNAHHGLSLTIPVRVFFKDVMYIRDTLVRVNSNGKTGTFKGK